MAKRKLSYHMVEVLAWASGYGPRELVGHSEAIQEAQRKGYIKWQKGKGTVITKAGLEALKEAAHPRGPRRR